MIGHDVAACRGLVCLRAGSAVEIEKKYRVRSGSGLRMIGLLMVVDKWLTGVLDWCVWVKQCHL